MLRKGWDKATVDTICIKLLMIPYGCNEQYDVLGDGTLYASGASLRNSVMVCDKGY